MIVTSYDLLLNTGSLLVVGLGFLPLGEMRCFVVHI